MQTEYNKTLYKMMERDSSFNIKMKKLGYQLKPVIAVVDLKDNRMYTADDEIDLATIDPRYAKLFDPIREDVTRIGMTKTMLERAESLVEDAPKVTGIEEPKEPAQSQDMLQQLFNYEMLLMARLEEELGHSVDRDKLRHQVEREALTPGITDDLKKLEDEALIDKDKKKKEAETLSL